ncbi:TRAUB-domain-containing protein [Coprinopsis marcescibilis]|uniref:Protein BFR2 n=1 Tax=Coprinopsis marcescibilis TaxID=230819 RepID=A0A5C3KY96_COPMA|nr:TRAUB-domain-containing protein [Coprinopsis marcescibilis]
MARLTLAEQLAQVDDAAPVDFDPEALDTNNEAGGTTEDLVAAREHYVDVGPSELRRLQGGLSGPQYEGKRISRKDLLELEEQGQSEDSYDGESESEEEFGGIGTESDESDANVEPDESGGQDSQSSEEESEDDDKDEFMTPPESTPSLKRPASQQEPPKDLTSTLQQARDADKKKGKAVARQIALWDTLLDSRIQIQKAVVAANKLPTPDAMSRFLEDPECSEALLMLSQEALALVDDITELQERLFTVNEGIKPPARKRRKLEDEANLANATEDLISACESASALEQLYHPHLVQTLSKWSAKIQAVAPSVLLPSNKGTFAKGKHQLKSAVQLVDDTLQDHQGLLDRTRLRRAPGTRVGTNPTADESSKPQANGQGEEATEIFDDTDFYQKMLRDIIDSRGGDGKNADWIAIQKQKKAKKEVDTKASKGRKIRYQVHEKIQNFMVPVIPVGAWHDEQVDELFSSLLGKGFENVVSNVNEDENRMQDINVNDGFRVFG